MASAHVFDRLIDRCRATGSSICVGLDPHLELLPPDGQRLGAVAHVRAFLFEILAAIEGVVPCVKPQVAFFEALGPEGYALYFEVIREAHRRGFFVIGDVKRADIGSTAAAYAKAHLGAEGGGAADAVTLNPYLGLDGIEPFLKVGRATGRGVFVLARTSNASAHDFQDHGQVHGQDHGHDHESAASADRRGREGGEPLYLKVGRALERWGAANVGERGFTDVGAVAGATHPGEGALLRRELPRTFFLVPGFGAQGAAAADAAVAFDARGEGAIVNSSRAILFAWKDAPDGARRFAELARAAALAATRAVVGALSQRPAS